MEKYQANKLFDNVNLTVKSVVQNGVSEIEKLVKKINNNESLKFLRFIKSFLDYGLSRLELSVDDYKVRQFYYCKLWHEVNKIQENYKLLCQKLEDQRKIYRENKSKLMTEYLNNIKILKELNKKYLTDAELISYKYERHQLNEYKQSLTRQNDLTQICAFTKSKTATIMATHKKLEIEMYSKRIKVISQFTSLLHRYDSEIGEKKRYLEKLKIERYNIEETLKQIEEIINEQSVIYDKYINKRHKIDIDRKEMIIKNNAAKIIQLWWKNILQKHKKIKKKKKKKKKKKQKKKKKRHNLP